MNKVTRAENQPANTPPNDSASDLRFEIQQLEGICRLWMAVASVKEARLAELETERAHLIRRVSRYARLARKGRRDELRRAAKAH